MSMVDEDILNDFVIESKEGLASIEDDFLSLENSQDGLDPDLINKIFRAIHSIKGASGFFDLKNICQLSHAMENIISKIRDGEFKPESIYIDPLLDGVDLLNLMLNDISQESAVESDTVIKKLESFLGEEAFSDIEENRSSCEAPAAPEMDDLQKEVLAELMGDLGLEAEPTAEQVKEKEIAPSQSQTLQVKEKPSKGKAKNNETLRISIDLLDQLMRMAGELVLIRNQQLSHIDRSDPISRSIAQKLDMVTSEIQEGILQTRMQPIGNIFGKFPRIIRDLGKKLHKDIQLDIIGEDVEMDKTIIEALTDPLTHLIRNSCDHGVEGPDERIEAGKNKQSLITLHAYHEGGMVNIKIQDDGRGIDVERVKNKVLEKGLKNETEMVGLSTNELANLITLPGLSTAQEVTDISGRGVGMDVVKTSIEKLGGTMHIETEAGKGTSLILKLPLTLAIIPSLLVQVGSSRFAIPQIDLDELVCLYDKDTIDKFEIANQQVVYRLRDRLLPMVHLRDILEYPEALTQEDKMKLIARQKSLNVRQTNSSCLVFAVLKIGQGYYGLIVDQVLGTEEIVVKPMHPELKHLSCYSGATVLGDGKVALILDVEGISQYAGVSYHQLRHDLNQAKEQGKEQQSSLILNNGGPEQYAIPLEEIKRIETVDIREFKQAGDENFINIEDLPYRVVSLDQVFPNEELKKQRHQYLILPKGDRHYGLLFSNILNIKEINNPISRDHFNQEGLHGSTLLDDQMTLVIHLQNIIHSTLKATA